MIRALFPTESQKLVKKWTKEHQSIALLSSKIIDSYEKGKYHSCKKYLKLLKNIVLCHVMIENIEFFKLLKTEGKLDPETTHMIKHFTKTFENTKITLIDFLFKYTKPETRLNDTFFEEFKVLVIVLNKRITFEEENLYKKLSA